MTPLDLFISLLPFAVLAWASLGRGIIARGRTQVMMWCILLIAFHTAGVTGVCVAVAMLLGLGVFSIRRHRLPNETVLQETAVDLRDYRGGQSVPILVENSPFRHLLDFRQDIGTAVFEIKVYTDDRGTYAAFSRTTLATGSADSLWMHSYYATGETISSSDELRAMDFPVPFQLKRMKVLDGLNALYAFHKVGIAAHHSAPLTLSAEEYLERTRQDTRYRNEYGCKSGHLRKLGSAYGFTVLSGLLAMARAFDLHRALSSESLVGGADPSALPATPPLGAE